MYITNMRERVLRWCGGNLCEVGFSFVAAIHMTYMIFSAVMCVFVEIYQTYHIISYVIELLFMMQMILLERYFTGNRGLRAYVRWTSIPLDPLFWLLRLCVSES